MAENGVPHAAHHMHLLRVADGRIVSDTVMCGGRWPAMTRNSPGGRPGRWRPRGIWHNRAGLGERPPWNPRGADGAWPASRQAPSRVLAWGSDPWNPRGAEQLRAFLTRHRWRRPPRSTRRLLPLICWRRTVRVARKGRMWLVPQAPAAQGDREGGAASNAAAAVLGAIARAAAVSQCPQHSRH